MCQLDSGFFYSMNYQRIHDAIIARAKTENRKKTKEGIYYEKHHIIPRCMGGTNENENLVLLTGREHFLVHWLLAEIHDTNKLWSGFYIMAGMDAHDKRYTPSSRIIEYARLKANKAISEYQTGKLWPEERKLKSSLSKKEKPCHPNTLKAVQNQANKYKFPAELLAQIALKKSKAIHQFDLEGNYITTFISISEAARQVNGKFSNISACCRKLQETSYGFKWKCSSPEEELLNTKIKENGFFRL